MCDVSKYTKVYEDFKNLHSDDFLQLITEAETQEEKNFFETVWNYLLQEKQKKQMFFKQFIGGILSYF